MYSVLFEQQAQLLKALAHPRRLEIVHLLRDQTLCVTDIYAMLDLPQANISQHLTLLKDAGVVQSQRQGKQIWYKITDPEILHACDLLRGVLLGKLDDKNFKKVLDVNLQELVPLTHDPVCNMRVSPKTAGATSTHQQHQYFFCASGCKKLFDTNPTHYV